MGRSVVTALVVGLAVGCAARPAPGDVPGDGGTESIVDPVAEPGAQPLAADPAAPAVETVPRVSYDIPPAHLPPPGQCRIWIPGEPPAEQAARYPIGQCSTLRASIPPGAWLVYRPTDDVRHVRVWQYGDDQRVLAQRIYDAATGQLIRHVAPAGG